MQNGALQLGESAGNHGVEAQGSQCRHLGADVPAP